MLVAVAVVLGGLVSWGFGFAQGLIVASWALKEDD